MNKLLIPALFASSAALAQSTTVVVVPPDYSYLHNAGQSGLYQAGQGLGGILGASLQGKRLVSAILTIECDYFTQVLKVYSDGTVETKEVALPADRVQLATVSAKTNGAISAVDKGCQK